MTRYVALLRGINVGGNNMIAMSALKACFEDADFDDVATYIQSGNVLFTPKQAITAAALTKQLESLLTATFNYRATVVVRDTKQMADVVKKAPKGFGADSDRYRYDVAFLKEPLTAAEAIKSWPLREGVDAIWPGPGVVYASRLAAKAAQSRMGRLISLPIYKSITIRNWNTSTKLAVLLGTRQQQRK
jgi:uncharacterized protein (DUF1697 family)